VRCGGAISSALWYYSRPEWFAVGVAVMLGGCWVLFKP
jgi:hypothetical protein